MTRILLAALAFAATSASAAERRYIVTDFDRIKVEGPFQVTLITGRAGSAVATGSAKAIDGVSIEVQNRTLRVRPNLKAWGGYPGEGAGAVSIAVSTHALRGAVVIGSGGLAIDKVKAMTFDASVSGSGRVGVANLETDKLTLALAGSGQLDIAGKAKTLRATIRGGGDLEARKLATEDAVIGADTAGSIGIAVRRSAKITATGAGDVEIIGAPACTVDAKGAGRVICGGKH